MTSMKERVLVAPMRGILVPIERVPDPVFSEKMVGDGVSIDPLEGLLCAPCDGEVSHLHKSHHAVTLKTADDVEIMMHIGLDTALLKGDGFFPKVMLGDRVKAGDTLIEFDLKRVAAKAPHLMTQIIITTMDRVTDIEPANVDQVEMGDHLFTYKLVDSALTASGTANGPRVQSAPIYLCNKVGLHARPAAVLTKMLSEFSAEAELLLGDKVANARSVTSLLKLNSVYGDEVILVAEGTDAEALVARVAPEIINGLGDEGVTPRSGPIQQAAVTEPQEVETAAPEQELLPNVLKGVSASSGLAIGSLYILKEEELNIVEAGEGQESEIRQLNRALAQARQDLDDLVASLTEEDPGKAAIFNAHKELLDDPELREAVDRVLSVGKSAAFAWHAAYQQQVAELAGLANQVLAERANDMRDVGQRVLHAILGVDAQPQVFPDNTILAAQDLTPSMTASLDTCKVLGFCTIGGGASSHVAILARAMGLPALVGMDIRILDLDEGTAVVLNSTAGEIRLNPDAAEIKKIETVLVAETKRKATELAACQLPAVTSDKHRIEVVANVGNSEEAQDILSCGGEGIGLLRSEFLFQNRAEAPSEDEQYTLYRRVIEAVGDSASVVIRTLDVGGDKPLSYLPLPAEENPFLGERGIRVGLNRPELLRTQLRALLRASAHGKLSIMFPMVSDLDEFCQAKSLLEEECIELGCEPVPLGIMVEVPAAAVMAEVFASEVDFFSIGTNDLTQYALAMDRGHPKLAKQADGLHPSVLRLIKMTVDAAHNAGKWVGVCGGIAGDPQAIPILVGLGVDELSVSIPAIPAVKAQIRSLSLASATSLAEQAMAVATAAEVRNLSPTPYSDERLADPRNE